jgi:preprotein translocase subunit SecD
MVDHCRHARYNGGILSHFPLRGPVRGFAVTLTIGLIANIFTAVFVSKTIFDYELGAAASSRS